MQLKSVGIILIMPENAVWDKDENVEKKKRVDTE